MDTLLLNADGNLLSLVPISIIDWKAAIRLVTLEKVNVLEEHDDWIVRSPSTTIKVPSVIMVSSYSWWKRNSNYSKNNILIRDEFTCQLQLTYKCASNKGQGHSSKDLTLDHVVPKSMGGKKTWTNIIAACKDCNNAKGNNQKINPKQQPYQPNYHTLVSKRKSMPIVIRDLKWLPYLDWDESVVYFQPYGADTRIKLTDFMEK